mgnify:CR=1 FL=1
MKKSSVILCFALFIITYSFKTAEEIKWLDFNTGYKLAVKKKKIQFDAQNKAKEDDRQMTSKEKEDMETAMSNLDKNSEPTISKPVSDFQSGAEKSKGSNDYELQRVDFYNTLKPIYLFLSVDFTNEKRYLIIGVFVV